MSIAPWAGFLALIAFLIIVDLGIINRRRRVIGLYESLAWTAFWVTLALAFNAAVYVGYEAHWFGLGLGEHALDGRAAALQFFTGYLIEKSLSVDNIFVVALIFSCFRVPLEYQHRVLFWGVFGAIALRGLMIAGGLVLIEAFTWTSYLFGAFLMVSAARMMVQRGDNIVPERNPFVRLLRGLRPVSTDFDDERFLTEHEGRRAVTPLLVTLVMVGTADVIFAVDSIPAIIAVTHDPFLVFTSNIFAIMGLRTLYYALAGMMQRLRYLKISLGFMLGFVGAKMLLAHHFPISIETSLVVIAAILALGVLASVLGGARDTAALVSPLAEEIERLLTLTYTGARRVVVLIVGSTVVLVGVVMIVTPGPAVVVIPAGLAILATEFVWARRLLHRVRDEARNLSGNAVNLFRRGKKGGDGG